MKRLLLPLLFMITLAACSRPGAEKPKTQTNADAPAQAEASVGEQRVNDETETELIGEDMVGLFREETINYYGNEQRLKIEFNQLKSLSAVHKATVREALDAVQSVFITLRTDESYNAMSDEMGGGGTQGPAGFSGFATRIRKVLAYGGHATLTDIQLLRAVREGRIDPAKDPKFGKELRNMILRYKLETWPQSKREEKVLQVGVMCIEQADKSASLVGI